MGDICQGIRLRLYYIYSILVISCPGILSVIIQGAIFTFTRFFCHILPVSRCILFSAQIFHPRPFPHFPPSSKSKKSLYLHSATLFLNVIFFQLFDCILFGKHCIYGKSYRILANFIIFHLISCYFAGISRRFSPDFHHLSLFSLSQTQKNSRFRIKDFFIK